MMGAVDVMCLPSHREPFGLVYVEAALAEKPVIACNAGGAPEIIHHGETGLLVPPPTRDQATTAGHAGGSVAGGSASLRMQKPMMALSITLVTLLSIGEVGRAKTQEPVPMPIGRATAANEKT